MNGLTKLKRSASKSLCPLLALLVLLGFPAFPAFSQTPPQGKNKKDLSDTDKKVEAARAKQNGNFPKVVIGPGDQLLIEVYGENLNTEYQVDSDGFIEFPYVGRVNLAGMTPVEASEKLDQLMDKPRDTTVLIRKSNTFWVSVIGDVRNPGKFEIRGQNNLASILSEVGGPLPDANLDRALLVHGTTKTFIPLRHLLRDEGDTGDPVYIYPGDMLMVYRGDWPASIGDVTSVIGLILSGITLYLVVDRLSK